MFGFTRTHRLLAAASVPLAIMGFGASSSTALPDPGPPAAAIYVRSDHGCLLERVGQQFTRCDDLTGNGVPAPPWIPQR